jgi:hypothetical protein
MSNARVAFITAVFGSYELTLKPHAYQSVAADFICFTDTSSANMPRNGWIVDTNPYHLTHPSNIENAMYTNSIHNNDHPFNIAKYYKQNFYNIPRLQQYDVIIWIDATLEIKSGVVEKTIEYLKMKDNIVVFEHEYRSGRLKEEVIASNVDKYTSTFWNGHVQPYQDVNLQYQAYLAHGYEDEWANWSNTINAGVWITCFVGLDMRNPKTREFLDLWYLQTLKYTTQDQVGFSYALQTMGLTPYPLPNDVVKGVPHTETDFYIKHDHGK